MREDRGEREKQRGEEVEVITSGWATRRLWLRMEKQEEEEEGEKLPSKNSEFMGTAGQDKVWGGGK